MTRMIAVFCVLFLYVFIRFIIPLKLNFAIKILSGVYLFMASQMELFFIKVGGTWFSPELPYVVMFLYGFSFTLFLVLAFITILKDLILIIRSICKLFGLFAVQRFTNNQIGIAILVLAFVVSCYSFYSATSVPHVVTQDLEITDLPKELEGLSVVGITDLHISALNKKPFTQGVVKKVNSLSPDIIIIAGDFVDGSTTARGDSLDPLKELHAKYGTFGIDGNHEYYATYRAWIDKFKSFGITMLENQNTILHINNSDIAIIGTTDHSPNIKKAYSNLPKNMPKILLSHRPATAHENSKYPVDFQFSGHTHGGMMIGLNKLIAKYNGGFVSGWYNVNNMKLYVSNGTSLWCGFPIRIGVPAEITKFILKRKK